MDQPDMDADYSVFVSNVMDVLGYSYDMIRQRKQMIDLEEQKDGTKLKLSGSKAEGTTSMCESDFDLMCVFKDIICTTDTMRYINIPEMTVFEAIHEGASPGYTFLKLVQYGYLEDDHMLKEFIDEVQEGNLYFASDFLRKFTTYLNDEDDSAEDVNVTFEHMQGPSIPMQIEEALPSDFVISLRCECPKMTEQFLSRDRKYDQPSKEILKEIASLDSHVVPVGSKTGEQPGMEWRICYTEAEVLLMSGLNETQIKVYILLKLLVKSVLKGSKDISSYIIKNVVLWMSELISAVHFTADSLVKRLLQALKLLRQCIKRRYLPNYMIPQRNLFCGKLKRYVQVKLLQQLSKMIDEGGNVLFMCPRLKRTMIVMYESPMKAFFLGNIRDKIEQWYWCMANTERRNNEDELDNLLELLMAKYCLPEIIQYYRNDIDEKTFDKKMFVKFRTLLL